MNDERLFRAFMDWWWFDELDPDEPPVTDEPPMDEIVDDFRSLIRALRSAGYEVVRSAVPA